MGEFEGPPSPNEAVMPPQEARQEEQQPEAVSPKRAEERLKRGRILTIAAAINAADLPLQRNNGDDVSSNGYLATSAYEVLQPILEVDPEGTLDEKDLDQGILHLYKKDFGNESLNERIDGKNYATGRDHQTYSQILHVAKDAYPQPITAEIEEQVLEEERLADEKAAEEKATKETVEKNIAPLLTLLKEKYGQELDERDRAILIDKLTSHPEEANINKIELFQMIADKQSKKYPAAKQPPVLARIASIAKMRQTSPDKPEHLQLFPKFKNTSDEDIATMFEDIIDFNFETGEVDTNERASLDREQAVQQVDNLLAFAREVDSEKTFSPSYTRISDAVDSALYLEPGLKKAMSAAAQKNSISGAKARMLETFFRNGSLTGTNTAKKYIETILTYKPPEPVAA